MPAPLREPPPHGTRQRYQWRRRQCRCEECTRANTLYVQSRRVIVATSGHDQPLPDVGVLKLRDMSMRSRTPRA